MTKFAFDYTTHIFTGRRTGTPYLHVGYDIAVRAVRSLPGLSLPGSEGWGAFWYNTVVRDGQDLLRVHRGSNPRAAGPDGSAFLLEPDVARGELEAWHDAARIDELVSPTEVDNDDREALRAHVAEISQRARDLHALGMIPPRTVSRDVHRLREWVETAEAALSKFLAEHSSPIPALPVRTPRSIADWERELLG